MQGFQHKKFEKLKKNKILVGLGHPAHYHLFKHIILNKTFDTIVVCSDKDILIELLELNHVDYIKLTKRDSSKNLFLKFLKIFLSSIRLIRIVKKERPELLVGCLTQISWAGWFCKKKVLFFAEDDFAYTKIQGKMTYPFVTHVVTAKGVNVGPYSRKQITYPSYQKLAYLHPDNLAPENGQHLIDKYKLAKDFFIIRLVNLSAHHDKNISGICTEELEKIVSQLCKIGQVIISAEKKLDPQWSKFQIPLDINDIHHLMKISRGVISDSQSMTVEAALLGVPNIRINDFKDKISILKELEYTFELTKSFFPNTIQEIEIEEFVSQNSITWQKRKEYLLENKINPLPFYENLIKEHCA